MTTLLALALALQDEELTFNFKDARVEDLLVYVGRAKGWTFVFEGKLPANATFSAVSDGPADARTIVDAVLRPFGLATLPPAGGVVKILKVEDAVSRTSDVRVGNDPGKIPVTDTVITQIVPLKGAAVADAQKELKDILDKCVDKWSASTHSNSLILTGRSEGIHRAVRILSMIDVKGGEALKTRVFPLRNSDATETSKLLNDLYKKEQTGRPVNLMEQFFQRREGEAAPKARSVATEIVRIVPDPRTNAIVCVATEENLKTIEDVIRSLDEKSMDSVRLRLYPLRHADAVTVAKLVVDLFAEKTTTRAPAVRPQWLGPQEPEPKAREIRAVADARTNSIVIAATEKQFETLDDLVAGLDRPAASKTVRIYELKNADASTFAKSLKALFGIEVQSDARTNSLIVQGTQDVLDLVDGVVRRLDDNPVEEKRIYAIRLIGHDAATLAKLLQDLLKGAGTQTTPTVPERTPPGSTRRKP